MYNPLGTRAVQQGNVMLAALAIFVFGFNGIVHLSWPAGGPPGSQVFFEFDRGFGLWETTYTFPAGGGTLMNAMVATGIVRLRRDGLGGGNWPMRYGGWRFQ